MAGVPAPREGVGIPGVSTTEWRLLEAIREVGQDVREMRTEFTGRFDQLPTRFVPRPEIEQFMRGSQDDRAQLRAELLREEQARAADTQRLTETHAAAIKALSDRIDSEEKERATAQRWALSLLATLLIALAGFGVTLFTNLH